MKPSPNFFFSCFHPPFFFTFFCSSCPHLFFLLLFFCSLLEEDRPASACSGSLPDTSTSRLLVFSPFLFYVSSMSKQKTFPARPSPLVYILLIYPGCILSYKLPPIHSCQSCISACDLCEVPSSAPARRLGPWFCCKTPPCDFLAGNKLKRVTGTARAVNFPISKRSPTCHDKSNFRFL